MLRQEFKMEILTVDNNHLMLRAKDSLVDKKLIQKHSVILLQILSSQNLTNLSHQEPRKISQWQDICPPSIIVLQIKKADILSQYQRMISHILVKTHITVDQSLLA